jgi:uncharacterized protein DUF6090
MNDDKAVRTRAFRFLPTLNWKGAIGELLLIVVGVLLALAVNNWNINRQDRKTEMSLLQQLHSSLAMDLANLKEADDGFRNRKQRMDTLRDHLGRGRPYADSLQSEFGAVLGIWPIHFNRSPYEVMKGKGLELISSDSLRLRIVHLYDQTYADYQEAQEDDRNVVFEIVRPYYLKAFRDIRFRESATPLSYEQISRDPYFMNVLDYRLRSLEVNSIGPAETAMNDVSSVLKELTQEIKRRR